MSATHARIVVRHRPVPVRVTIGVLIFLGLTAVAGGVALTFGTGEGTAPPSEMLEQVPLIDSWVIPGLVLGIGFGLGSLVAAYGMLRRPRWSWLGFVERATGHHWSWVATVLIGAGHLVWIALELIYLPDTSWLQAVYGGTGLALVLLPMLPSVRADLRARPMDRS